MIPFFSQKGMSEVFTRTLSSNSTGWANYTLVLLIPSSQLQGPSSTTRLTFSGSSTSNTQITEMYIGHKGSDSFDFSSTPTQVKVSGSGSFLIPQNSTLVSDDINFEYDGSDLVVSMYLTNSSPNDIKTVFSGAGCSYFFKTGNEASTVNKSGYSAGGSNPNLCAVISKIEMDV